MVKKKKNMSCEIEGFVKKSSQELHSAYVGLLGHTREYSICINAYDRARESEG